MRVRLTSVAAASLVVALLSFITNVVEGRDKSANQVVTSEIVRLLNSGVSFAPDGERFR